MTPFAGIAGVIIGVACLAMPARADTIYLKSGEVRAAVVERFSDGAFWVRDGNRTVIIRPDEILKIIFTEQTDFLARVRPAEPPKRAPDPRPASPGGLMVAPASASSADSMAAAPGDPSGHLVILDYRAMMNKGIFQVIGSVENRTAADARYVKITVTLIDEDERPSDQNFSYVQPSPPHLKPGERKEFRVSFINPPPKTAKYKIRVESSTF